MKCQGERNGRGETEAGLFFCSPGTFHLEVHVCLSLPMLAECTVFLYHLSNMHTPFCFKGQLCTFSGGGWKWG